MSYRWKATIEIWPYFAADGIKSQEQAGPRSSTFVFENCENLDEATRRIKDIQVGIRTNPNVWSAPIRSVVYHECQDHPWSCPPGEIELR